MPFSLSQQAELGDVFNYTHAHLLPILLLESVLFGMVAKAATLFVYGTCRPGFLPFNMGVRDRLMRSMACLVLFILFTVHWVLSIKQVGDLLTGGWAVRGLALTDADPDYERDFFFSINLGPLILECAAFGAFFTLSAVVVYIFAHRDMRARSQQAMLATALLMFTISLVHLAIQVHIILNAHRTPTGVFQPDRLGVGFEIGPLALISANILLGDGVVLWRTCTLTNQDHRVRVVAMLLLTSTTSLGIVNIIDEARRLSGDRALFSLAGFSEFPAGIVVLGLSLATNVISTIIIGWKAWRYRRHIVANLATFSRHSMAEKVLTLLVESGFMYCFVWTLFIVDSESVALDPSAEAGTARQPLTGGARYFSRYVAQITGIYPTLILVTVAREQSYIEKAFSESKLSAFVAARPRTNSRRSTFSSSLARFSRRAVIRTHEEPEETTTPGIADVEASRESFDRSAGPSNIAEAATRASEPADPAHLSSYSDAEQGSFSVYQPGMHQHSMSQLAAPYRALPLPPSANPTVQVAPHTSSARLEDVASKSGSPCSAHSPDVETTSAAP